MTKQQIINAAVNTMEEIRMEYVANPKTRYQEGGSTGNMAANALSYEITDKHIIIYIDTNKAPYVPYTNEPWISPKWGGKKNPNEGWWDIFANEFIKRFNQKLRGTIK